MKKFALILTILLVGCAHQNSNLPVGSNVQIYCHTHDLGPCYQEARLTCGEWKQVAFEGDYFPAAMPTRDGFTMMVECQ